MSDIKIVNIQPRDIFVTFEISLEKVKKLVVALENSSISLDMSTEEGKEASKAIQELFTVLDGSVEAIEGNGT